MNNQEEQDEANSVMDWQEVLRLKTEEQTRQRAAMVTAKKFISFRGGRMSVDKVPVPYNKLEVVILSFTCENTFYKNKYDPTISQTPVCWAVFDDVTDMNPDPTSKEIQCDDCATCPHYQWGSDPQGGRGKACKTRYRLCVVPAGDVESAFRFATLPVTSGKLFEEYLSKLELNFNKPTFVLMTEMELLPDDKSQYIVKLSPLSIMPDAAMANIVKRLDAAELAVRYPYVNYDDDEEDTPPPVKTKVK